LKKKIDQKVAAAELELEGAEKSLRAGVKTHVKQMDGILEDVEAAILNHDVVKEVIKGEIKDRRVKIYPKKIDSEGRIPSGYHLIREASTIGTETYVYDEDSDGARHDCKLGAGKKAILKALEIGAEMGAELVQTTKSFEYIWSVKKLGKDQHEITAEHRINVAFYSRERLHDKDTQIESNVMILDPIVDMMLDLEVEAGHGPTIDTIDMLTIDPNDAVVDQETGDTLLVDITVPTPED
jgi:hypothetical protein